MATIESYRFGRMVIDGASFSKDVIIFPDNSILSPWWREKGHVLSTGDLEKLIGVVPQVIICGTGAMGIMKPTDELKEYLASVNIEFIVQKTGKAVETFNQLSCTKKAGGCFHLTC